MENLYYTIGQVSTMTELPQSVLRYWETVFEQLKPAKSQGGSRQYSMADITLIKTIKSLLYDEGYTIKGAQSKLRNDFKKSKDILEQDTDSQQQTTNHGKTNISENKTIVKASNKSNSIGNIVKNKTAIHLQTIRTEIEEIIKILES